MTDTFNGRGGIALYSRDFLTALASMPSCTEILVIPRLDSGPSEPLPDKVTYFRRSLGGKLKYVTGALAAARSRKSFDLILCGHINLLPVAFMLRPWITGPIVLLIYGIDAWSAPKSGLSTRLVRRISHFVSISEITKRHFMEWAPAAAETIAVIPNAIHLERYRPGPKNDALLKRYDLGGKTVLMTLGRMDADERYKGFDEILEVLPKLSKAIPNIAYLLVGDGSDRARLQKKAKELGLSERVVFAGFVSEAEKADHLRLADVFAMPSRGEGFGFVFLEAMACGIPVVASRLDGGREAVRDGMLGVMVDPADSCDIARGILHAIGSNSRTLPDGLQHFAYPEFEQRVHHFIESMLHSARAERQTLFG